MHDNEIGVSESGTLKSHYTCLVHQVASTRVFGTRLKDKNNKYIVFCFFVFKLNKNLKHSETNILVFVLTFLKSVCHI